MTPRSLAILLGIVWLLLLAPPVAAGGSPVAVGGGGGGVDGGDGGDAAGATAPVDGACTGRMTEPAAGITVVSTQGARLGDDVAGKRPARLVAFGPTGEVLWVHHSGREHGVVWSYDVDPMADGDLFVTATTTGRTELYELNTTTGEREWVETLNMTDTHDADYLGDGRIVVANMRNYDAANGTNDDRVVVYDRTTDEIVWEWRFERVFDREGGGDYEEDWTHLNDVDAVGDGRFLLSPRNFDSVLLVDRDSKEVVRRLGRDDRHEILFEQHNPDYLRSDGGRDTFLVADSENDRVVEYEHTGLRWRRTWTAGSSETLNWPRDADRLPDGNTLVADSRNDRVVELTPDGEVVWEAYAPWLVYDVERVPVGDGSRGPTVADVNAGGATSLQNASPPSVSRRERCAAALRNHSGGFGNVAESTTPTTTVSPPSTASSTRSGGDPGTAANPVQGIGDGFGLRAALFAVAALVVALGRSRERGEG
ncbi:MAG: aryl-sulfate sulfotransferase [Halolamina sp.]